MYRAAVLVTFLGGACASRPAEKLEEPKPIDHVDEPQPAPVPPRPRELPKWPKESRVDVISSPPPDADPRIAEAMAALDVHEYERWPLSHNQHPALEPAFPIAKVFAQPGVSWLDLCRQGAQNRRGGGNTEQLEYLRGWCEVAKRDARAAVMRLAPLVRSPVLGMPAAVRFDIANIVVDAGDADDAARVLASAQVDDVAIYDLVAASYAEVGKSQDALVFADRAIAAQQTRKPAEHCMRIARKAVISDPGSRMAAIQELAPFANGDCVRLHVELKCWHAKRCEQYLIAYGVKPESVERGELYASWPKPGASVEEWTEYAKRTTYYVFHDGGDLTISVLEAALRDLKCEGAGIARLIGVAERIRADSKHDASLDARISNILLMPETICRSR
jgi:hypothetical protein